jgi:hypothetical protein
LRLGRLGNGARGNPLATATLLFVTQAGGGISRTNAQPVGGRPLTISTLPVETPKIRAFNKRTGVQVWEKELPLGPAGTPMTYSYRNKQYLAVAIGSGAQAEIIAFALP